MLAESMKAVEAAEKAASEIVSDARNEADKIRKNSEAESEQMKQKAYSDAKTREAEKMKQLEESRVLAAKNAEQNALKKAE